MKKLLIPALCTVVILGMMSFAGRKAAVPARYLYTRPFSDSTSPIDGNWQLVSTIVNGKMVAFHRTPGEFKMFHDGYFSFLTYDADGKFDYAGAGTFKLEDGKYTEKFDYCSQPDHVGGWNIQRWSMAGDTLVFTGYEKMEGPTGKDMMPVMGKDTIVEKRIRVKPAP